MFILLPIPVINPHTDKEEDVTISLVPITFASVLSIDEDKETGYAIIRYHSGTILKTKLSFIKLMENLSSQNAVNFLGLQECQKVSKTFKDYVNPTNKE